MAFRSPAELFRPVRSILCAGLSAAFSCALPAAEQPREMVRLNVASLPAVAENLSGIGNAVAPGFADSVAMLTVIFSMTPPALLMDVTKPFSILFYESRTAPAVCFVAYARPNVRLSEKSDLKIGSLKMEAEPFQKDHLLIKTPNLPGIHPPLFLPAETSAVVLKIEADPRLLKQQFNLKSLASEKAKKIPAAMDDFIESFQRLSLTVRMPSQNRIMLELSGRLSRDSNLRKYLAAPPALHSVSSFENAEELFILNIPADRSFREYLLRILPGFSTGLKREEHLRRSLVNASSGMIAASVSFRNHPDATAGDRPLVKAVFGLERSSIPDVKKSLDAFPETPFGGLRLIAREDTAEGENLLFSRIEDQSIVFFYCGMVQAQLQTLMKEKKIMLKRNDPFALHDLKSGKTPVTLECRGEHVLLKIDADKEFFRQFPPLIDKPIHQLMLTHENAL